MTSIVAEAEVELDKVIVVKIGGATLGSHDTTIEDIVSLQQGDRLTVVVHGGGKLITDWLSRLGISTRFVMESGLLTGQRWRW